MALFLLRMLVNAIVESIYQIVHIFIPKGKEIEWNLAIDRFCADFNCFIMLKHSGFVKSGMKAFPLTP